MSSTNNRFEIAVAVPITNNSFNHLNRFSATIGDITGTSITLSGLQTDSDASVSHASEVMAVDDRITLKATDGTVDTTTLSAVNTSGLTITTDEDMSTDFSSGDTIVGYGNVVPGGWSLTGYEDSTSTTVSRGIGAFDNFSISLYGKEATASTFISNKLFGVIQDINTDYFVSNLRYRHGLKYKYQRVSEEQETSWEFDTGLYSNFSNKVFMIKSGKASVTSWTSTSFSTYLTDSSISNFYLYLYIKALASEKYDACYAYLDDIYLEHIYNPVSKLTLYGNTAANSADDTTVGYYEIANNHDYQSLNITRLENYQDVQLANNSLDRYDSTGWGERNIKYEVTCSYTDVDNDIYLKLVEFLNIQKNGYMLNLHPYVEELPSVLTGYMYIENVNKSHWDVGLISFNFKFREA